MLDLRPVTYVIGLLVAVLGLAMLAPMAADLAAGDAHWRVFLQCAVLTASAGGLMALASANGAGAGMTVRLSFLMTTGVWIALPAFGALPFLLGAPRLPVADAVFEAMSGMTTTGATMIDGLDGQPRGILLWRGILQWLGGLGIVIVAMIFLPVMKVGGMQFFQSEGFDTLGKALPRALDIARGLLAVYCGLSLACAITYFSLGLSPFEAVVHALTTVSTGGFSTTDASFAAFPGAPQYAAVVFMLLASIPFIRVIQTLRGHTGPLLQDSQLRAYLVWTAYAVLLITVFRVAAEGGWTEDRFRSTLFNTVSFFSGTGYGDGDVLGWGPFPFTILFCIGAIGGCSGSTGCSIKVFRYQILLRAIAAQCRKLHSPNRVVSVRYEGRTVDPSVIDSIMLLFTLFVLSFGLMIVGLGMTGLSFLAAMTGAWTAIFNVGPAFGPEVAASGALAAFPDPAKWIMIAGMLLGRLECVSVIVLLLPRFWRS